MFHRIGKSLTSTVFSSTYSEADGTAEIIIEAKIGLIESNVFTIECGSTDG